MKGRMNAVFDRLNGTFVSKVYRVEASPASFSTPNRSDSSAGTDRFLGNLNDKAKTRSSSTFQLDDGEMSSVIEAAHCPPNLLIKEKLEDITSRFECGI